MPKRRWPPEKKARPLGGEKEKSSQKRKLEKKKTAANGMTMGKKKSVRAASARGRGTAGQGKEKKGGSSAKVVHVKGHAEAAMSVGEKPGAWKKKKKSLFMLKKGIADWGKEN